MAASDALGPGHTPKPIPAKSFEVRPATADDAAAIIDVILDAGSMFRSIGMDAVSDNPPPTVEDIADQIKTGKAWVATSAGDVIGCILVHVVDGDAHIDQVSTARAHAGRGIGRRLIEQAETWARSVGHQQVTLTTFTEVAWNAPYYRSLGYHSIAEDMLGAELAGVRAEEARLGLDDWGRCTMVRDLG